MSIGRISTFALHQATLRDAINTSATLADLQGQLSSGLKSRTFEGIADQTEQYLSLDNKISRVQLYQNNNKLVTTRMDTTNTILDQSIETVTSLKNLILQRRNATNAETMAFPEQLDGLWKSLVGQMNTTLEGRYIFSGTRTDSPAVDADTFPTLQVSGVPDQGYYQGSNDNVTVHADDNVDITYNVRANSPGFQKVFAALAMAKQGHANTNDDDLKKAFDLAAEGLQDIISEQAKVNANKVSIEQITDRQKSLQLYWQGLKEDISNADIVAVSTQVAINQGLLQASFQAFAKITSLNLSQYLR